MKYISSLILLLTIFCFSGFSQNIKEEYAQKIKEATPKSLPQTPVLQRPTSDAQDDGLKGRVKSLIGERIGLSGVEKPIGRRMMLIQDFDERGNYLREVNFEYRGRPYNTVVYGYIDGVRVSLSNPIYYGDELFISSGSEKEKKTKTNEPDPRYDYKYEFKYADGKLSEMQMFLNTGEEGMRYVYKYNGNKREYLAYSDNKLNQRYIYTFDNKGNEIEQIYYKVYESPDSVGSIIKYKNEEFDKQGNWTKRSIVELNTVDKKVIESPIAIEYRQITYYP